MELPTWTATFLFTDIEGVRVPWGCTRAKEIHAAWQEGRVTRLDKALALAREEA